MRRLRYQVATSLDGYIAGPNGEYDWIVQDPDIDFNALFAQFDTVVMGRKTFELALSQGGNGSMPGMDVYVYSRTLSQADYPAVSIINSDPAAHVRSLKAQPRKSEGKADKGAGKADKSKGKARGEDIWLFGGGELFRTLLDAGVVDTVEPAVMPVLIGGGLPMLPPPTASHAKLSLSGHRLYPKSGIMLLQYTVIA